MADVFTKAERSRCMAAIKNRGNKQTELKLVEILRASGIKGWRRHPHVPSKPDFVFYRQRVAIFVDGCFWHGCSKHCRMPASNADYWEKKISRNVIRDRTRRARLAKIGWITLRIWEHELRNQSQVAIKIITAIRKQGLQKEIT